MKFRVLQGLIIDAASRPARGAWVEIKKISVAVKVKVVAPRKGRVG